MSLDWTRAAAAVAAGGGRSLDRSRDSAQLQPMSLASVVVAAGDDRLEAMRRVLAGAGSDGKKAWASSDLMLATTMDGALGAFVAAGHQRRSGSPENCSGDKGLASCPAAREVPASLEIPNGSGNSGCNDDSSSSSSSCRSSLDHASQP